MNLTRDVEFINRVMNHPAVFPHVCSGMPYPLDFSSVMADEGNLFYANEHGGFLAFKLDDGVYDIHTQFLPEGRGEMAREAAREFRDFMFTKLGASLLMTVVPPDNAPARKLAEEFGFVKVWKIDLGDVYELRSVKCPQAQS